MTTPLPPRLQKQLDRFLDNPAPDDATRAGGEEALTFQRLLQHPAYLNSEHEQHDAISRRVRSVFDAEFGDVETARRPNPIVLDTSTGQSRNLLSRDTDS